MNIRTNIQAWLDHHGIKGCEFIEEPEMQFSDRVYVWDRQGMLLKHCVGRERYFSKHSGDNHTRVKGVDTVRMSFRERARPSLQVTVQEAPLSNPESVYLELDFDFHNPSEGFAGLFGHAAEVFKNKLTGCTTDQEKVALGLQYRFGLPAEEHKNA